MNDFIGDRQCVTHHNACDCREAKFKKIQSENISLRKCHEAELGVCQEHCDVVSTLQAENLRLTTIIDNRAEDLEVKAKYEAARDEIKDLQDLLLSLKNGFTYVGSAYSGHRTSRAVEVLLDKALGCFQPARQWIHHHLEALKEGGG